MAKGTIRFATGIIISLIAVVTVVYASNTGWSLKSGSKKDVNSEFHKRYPRGFKDDITSDQDVAHIKLTKAQKHQALVWQLSEVQEKRYVALMKNRSGFFYAKRDVTPVEVLGFNARTDEERAYYAQLDVQQQFQHLAKYLAFLAEYGKSAKQLKEELSLPIIRKFDYAKFSPYHYKPVDIKPNDKFMLFVSLDNEVRPVVSYLMDEMSKDKTIHLNVYFVGKNLTKDKIEKWAAAQNIPTAWVGKNKKITLDFGNSKFKSLHTSEQLPVLVLVRRGKSHFVNTGRF